MFNKFLGWFENKKNNSVEPKFNFPMRYKVFFDRPQIKSVFGIFDKLKELYNSDVDKLRIKLDTYKFEYTTNMWETIEFNVELNGVQMMYLLSKRTKIQILYNGSIVHEFVYIGGGEHFFDSESVVEDALNLAKSKIERLKRYALIKDVVKRKCDIDFDYSNTIRRPSEGSAIVLALKGLLSRAGNKQRFKKLLIENNITYENFSLCVNDDYISIGFVITVDISIDGLIEKINLIKSLFDKVKNTECEYLKSTLHSIIKVTYSDRIKLLYVSNVSEPMLNPESISYVDALDGHLHTLNMDGVICYTLDLLNKPLTTLMPLQQAKLYFEEHYATNY